MKKNQKKIVSFLELDRRRSETDKQTDFFCVIRTKERHFLFIYSNNVIIYSTLILLAASQRGCTINTIDCG